MNDIADFYADLKENKSKYSQYNEQLADLLLGFVDPN